MLREILYRGQTRRFGEKIKNFAGDPMPSNWVFGGVCTPPNVQGCFSIIYGTGDAYRDYETGITCKNTSCIVIRLVSMSAKETRTVA
mgnify:CR=1 FL=1